MASAEDVAGFRTALRAVVSGVEQLRARLAADLGVGTTDLMALSALFRLGAMTPRELGAELGLTSGSVTALCDRLVQGGLVDRQTHPSDRRRVVVTLSRRGSREMGRISRVADRHLGRALDTASRDGGADPVTIGQVAGILHVIAAEFSAGVASS